MKAFVAALAIVVAANVSASATPPAELYTLNCWGCHQPHAEGIPGTVPRLAHSMGFFLETAEGRAYLVRVPGVANSPLDDEQIAQVLNWLLITFNKDEVPKNYQPYSVEEIRKWRPHPFTNVKAARAQISNRLAAMGYTVSPDL